MRVILHPGFHKTGTSTLQACLAANRAALAPYAHIMLENDLTAALRPATRFAVDHDPFALASFTASFAEACQSCTAGPAQTLLISCEGLSGRTPGKNGITDYAAAPPLARAMSDAIRAVYGRKTDLTLIYTTRAPEDWLWSAWRHNLWGYRITEDFAEFRQTYAKAANFSGILAHIAALVPKASLLDAPLQSGVHPATPILNLLGLPQDVAQALHYPAARNIGRTAEQSAALLALNRSDLPDTELKRRKQALLAQGG